VSYQQQRAGADWWDGTWNPVGGCKPVSRGCKNCYAAKLAATLQTATEVEIYLDTTKWVRGRAVFNGKLTLVPPHHQQWLWPLQWKGAEHPVMGDGMPFLIFVVDMADLFQEDRATSIIDEVVGTIAATPHIGQLLTKRPQLMRDYFTQPRVDRMASWRKKFWLGFSAEGQQEFDERWPHVRELATRGWIVFVSIAPMLEPVRLPSDFLCYGNRAWAICSGEQNTGAGARPMDLDWARDVRDQCADAGVPFFFLQCSSRQPIPRDLFIRQFPATTRTRANQ
jgi:protein gp37